MLFGFESEGGQAGVASVPVNAVGRAGRPVRTRGRRHGRVDAGRADPVQVADVVQARGGHARHGGVAHPGGHGHGGDGVGRREHGLRGEGTHGVEEGEVLGRQRRRGEALVGPVVVGVRRVHVVIRLHEAAELRQVAVLAQVHLLVPLPLPPLSPAVFEPHLEETHAVSTVDCGAESPRNERSTTGHQIVKNVNFLYFDVPGFLLLLLLHFHVL